MLSCLQYLQCLGPAVLSWAVRERVVRVLWPKIRVNRMPGIPGGRTEIEIMEARAGMRP